MRSVRIGVLVLVLMLAGGCGLGAAVKRQAGPVTAPTVAPTGTRPRTDNATATSTVSGRALDWRRYPISGVGVGLRSTTCSSCSIYSAQTDSSGTYRMQVPNGVYVAACVAGSFTCRFSALPNDATVKITADGGNLTADITISQPGGDQTTGPTQQSNDPNGTVISGHVYYSNGKPVPGATVEFRKAGCPDCMPQPWTTTNSNGAYSIDVGGGVFNAECPDPIGCEVQGGNGGPYPVTVPPSTTVDFIVNGNG